MKKHLHPAIYFSLGFFALFECDSFFGSVSKAVFSAEIEYLVYGVGCFAAAFGVILFFAFKRMNMPVKRILLFTAFMCAAAVLIMAHMFQNVFIFWTSLILFYIAEGLNAAVCAFYVYKIREDDKNIKAGTLLAVTAAAGLILTYAAEFLFNSLPAVRMALLFITILAMMFFAFKKIDITGIITEHEQAAADKIRKRGQNGRYLPVLLAVAASIASIAYMIGVNDAAIFTAMLSDTNSAFLLPQLLYIPGLLAAGLLADVKNGRFLSIATLGCTLLTAPTAMHLTSPENFATYSATTYFLGGFYLIYSMVSLVTIAGRGKHPSLNTSAAALIFFLFSGVGALTSSMYFRPDGVFSLSVFIGLTVLMLVVFYLSGSLQPISAEQQQHTVPDKKLLENYGFTNREKEVLQLLLDGHSTAGIAEKMAVTEKTVYKYISALLSKTDKPSRASMLVMFNPKDS